VFRAPAGAAASPPPATWNALNGAGTTYTGSLTTHDGAGTAYTLQLTVLDGGGTTYTLN
jgi:hypothetical protein